MGRQDEHIDHDGLQALVRWPRDIQGAAPRLPAEKLRTINRHLDSCARCRGKLTRYRQLASRVSQIGAPLIAVPSTDCAVGRDVDWHEVAAGRWPEARASQLILHAAMCAMCGPILRSAATTASRLKNMPAARSSRPAWRFGLANRWALATVPLICVVGMLVAVERVWRSPLNGSQWAKLTVATHEQYVAGDLPLSLRSDSPQALNEWLRSNAQLPFVLPTRHDDNAVPYRLRGARMVQTRGRKSVFVTYEIPSGVASLTVSPDSVALASGGVEAHFKKVSFHYSMVEGYKVVTWSQHGLTYALVSRESAREQVSCMICHSAMRDRDLSHTPTPL